MALVIRTTGLEQFLDKAGEPNIKVLMLGDSGGGKTRGASYWPRPFYISFDKSLASIADRRMPHVTPKSSADIKDTLTFLRQEAQKPLEERRFKTIVVDTIDAAQRWIFIPEILAPQSGKVALSGYSDYGLLKAKTASLAHDLLALPFNLVVNCHLDHGKVNDEVVLTPAIEGKYSDQIADDFDLIGQVRRVQELKGTAMVIRHEVRWAPTPACQILKDRFGRLPDSTPVDFADTDYSQLFEYLFGDHLDSLKPSEDIGSIEATAARPEPPMAGGPVPVDEALATSSRATAKKAAAPPKAATKATKKASPKLAAPEGMPVPAAKDVPAVQQPAEAAPETEQAQGGTDAPEAPTETVGEAVAIVAGQLGGRVVEEGPTPEPETAAAVEQTPPTVATPAPAAVVDPPKAQVQSERPYPNCGKHVRGGKKEVQSCGKSLEGEDVNKVNISLLKYGTYLCESCLDRAMAAA